jgi:hypothetical protein
MAVPDTVAPLAGAVMHTVTVYAPPTGPLVAHGEAGVGVGVGAGVAVGVGLGGLPAASALELPDAIAKVNVIRSTARLTKSER